MTNEKDDVAEDLLRWIWRIIYFFGICAAGCWALAFTVAPDAGNPAAACSIFLVIGLLGVLFWEHDRRTDQKNDKTR